MRTPHLLAAFLLALPSGCRAPETARSAHPPADAASVALGMRAGPIVQRALALEAACKAFRAENHIVGMSVAVLEHGLVVLDAPFGLADRERRLPVTHATLFRLGSISKPVTATIALQLVEEDRVDLDVDVRLLVPEAAARIPRMSLGQILSHTAGIRHYRPGRRDNSSELKSTAEALELFIGDPLLSEPGTKYSYSTHGYTLAVAALEHASGKDFVELVRTRIRDRGAATLDCEVLADAKPGRSALYELTTGGSVILHKLREDNSWKYGGGGMESNALDLARFGDAVRTAELVSERSRERMWSPTRLADGSTSNYGLGWRLAPERGEIMHTGSQQGAQSVLVIVPAEGLVIAAMTNTSGSKPQELVPVLRRLMAPVTNSAAP